MLANATYHRFPLGTHIIKGKYPVPRDRMEANAG